MKRIISHLSMLVLAVLVGVPAAQGQIFKADSKSYGSSKMDIVIREIERRPASSVIELEIVSAGSSVGSSFFVLCSIRELARLRGDYRYVVKLEDTPKRRQMLIGFLRTPEDRLAEIAPEFAGLDARTAVIDLDPFGEICGMMK